MVKPNVYQTISYKFLPDPRLESTELALVIDISYLNNMTSEWYVATIYNGTIHILPPRHTWDVQLYFLYLVGGAIIAAAGWAMKQAFVVSKSKTAVKSGASTKKKTPVEASSSDKSVNLDWVPEHVRSRAEKSRKH